MALNGTDECHMRVLAFLGRQSVAARHGHGGDGKRDSCVNSMELVQGSALCRQTNLQGA